MTPVALAITLGTHHANRRFVDKGRIGTEFARDPKSLGQASRVAVDEHVIRFLHRGLLPTVPQRWAILRGIGRSQGLYGDTKPRKISVARSRAIHIAPLSPKVAPGLNSASRAPACKAS